MTTETMNRYRTVLGVRSDADMDAINTTYFLLIDKLSANPTEEEAKRLQEVQHAYSMLRRAKAQIAEDVSAAKALEERPRTSLRSLGVAAGMLATLVIVLLAMNAGRIRLAMIDHKPGAVLFVRGQTTPFGTVVGFSDHHQFASGAPTPAYEIQPDGKTETVWVGERTVDLTMSTR